MKPKIPSSFSPINCGSAIRRSFSTVDLHHKKEFSVFINSENTYFFANFSILGQLKRAHWYNKISLIKTTRIPMIITIPQRVDFHRLNL
jgi:hypothetical protein